MRKISEKRKEYDLNGRKVLILINVQNYPKNSQIELLKADMDVKEIKFTFEERVT